MDLKPLANVAKGNYPVTQGRDIEQKLIKGLFNLPCSMSRLTTLWSTFTDSLKTVQTTASLHKGVVKEPL